MNDLIVKIKKLSEAASIPTYAHDGEDACFDIKSVSHTCDAEGNIVYSTGLVFEIPKGYVGLIFPRSSISGRGLMLSNTVGVIDSGFRDEVKVKMKPTMDYNKVIYPKLYETGEKCCQMMIIPIPHVVFEETCNLASSQRGTSGWGDSGK